MTLLMYTLAVKSVRSIPNSKSCKRIGGSVVISWLFKVFNSTFAPHGNLAKVDMEDVATYIQKQIRGA